MLRVTLTAASLAVGILVFRPARLGVADRGAFLGATLKDDFGVDCFGHRSEPIK